MCFCVCVNADIIAHAFDIWLLELTTHTKHIYKYICDENKRAYTHTCVRLHGTVSYCTRARSIVCGGINRGSDHSSLCERKARIPSHPIPIHTTGIVVFGRRHIFAERTAADTLCVFNKQPLALPSHQCDADGMRFRNDYFTRRECMHSRHSTRAHSI